jgi:hypothetical protein
MLKLTLKGSAIPRTKMPNHLVDQVMPKLRDTELRVLLVLLRYTVGWQVPRDHAFLT